MEPIPGVPDSLVRLLTPTVDMAQAWRAVNRADEVIRLAVAAADGDEAAFARDLADRLWWVLNSQPLLPMSAMGLRSSHPHERVMRMWVQGAMLALQSHIQRIAPDRVWRDGWPADPDWPWPGARKWLQQ